MSIARWCWLVLIFTITPPPNGALRIPRSQTALFKRESIRTSSVPMASLANFLIFDSLWCSVLETDTMNALVQIDGVFAGNNVLDGGSSFLIRSGHFGSAEFRSVRQSKSDSKMG